MRKIKTEGDLDYYSVGDRFEAIKTTNVRAGITVEIIRINHAGYAEVGNVVSRESFGFTYIDDEWYHLIEEKNTLRSIIESM